ncbi:alpha/beta fold hydrolase [Scopulibacillus cellulosilyticus]|uniref:Alpha/beta fold hydrolase n=1 Tax=Scopulibacillus cellulosilyticus TaxID=2665665 RepID=A0ABW2PXF5_9BACL
MQQLKEQHIKLNDVNIFVKTMGHGEPLIFLHGGPGDEHKYFLPHVEPLSNDFTLIFYDQSGCGQSGTSENYSMEQEIEILEALRQKLGIQKMNVLGQSWGTILGLLYATTYPDHVNKLMLVSAVGATGEGFKAFSKELRDRLSNYDSNQLKKLEENYNERLKSDPDQLIKEFTQITDPYYVHNIENLKRKIDTKINVKVNSILSEEILKNYDVRKYLSLLKEIPILILQGNDDLFTPKMVEQNLLEYLPHAEFVVFPFSGHWPFLEETKEFNDVTKLFFEDS